MKNTSTREVPSWAIAAAITVTVGLAAMLGRSAITGRPSDPGPPKKVFPGMYDIRAEAQKARQSAAPAGTENGR